MKKNHYKPPSKPDSFEGQVSALWDVIFNGFHHQIDKIEMRQDTQDTKLSFIMILLGLILACIAADIFL